jgi:3-methylfumaryl-CoA hydratase
MHPDVVDHLRRWIGRTETVDDLVAAAPLRSLAATLDRDDAPPAAGDAVPAGGHRLYFLPAHRQSQLGADGHAQRGGFLPPVARARRMWAGSTLEFVGAPLRIGQAITRCSQIVDLHIKDGRSGPLVFVAVQHEVFAEGRLALRDRHDIVYRDPPQPGEPVSAGVPAPTDAQRVREIVPDDVLLFRYSGLTFNGHRIHYDRRYATEVEGYPGLVVLAMDATAVLAA